MTNADVDPALIEILTAVQPLVQDLATKDWPPAAPGSAAG